MLVSSGCDKPPDKPFCRKKIAKKIEILDEFGFVKEVRIRPNPDCIKTIGEAECGYCVWFVSDKQMYIGNKPENMYEGQAWDEILEEAIQLPLSTFVSFKAYARTQCKKSNCDKQIPRWRVKFDKLEGKK
jgi:hypothetical protein